MKIFMTGATGYIGSAIARAASEAGHTVLALAHHARAAADSRDRGLVPCPGDLRDSATLAKHAAKADAVIHAAHTSGDDAESVDRIAVETMVEALAGTNRPFVYTSGIWVLGATSQAIANEHSKPHPAAIVAWRAALERWLRDAGPRLNVRTIILRPGIVFGGGGGIPIMTARGELPLIEDGTQRWPLVHRDDLADLYLLALDRAPAGAILHGVSGQAPAAEIQDLSEGHEPVWASLDDARATLGSFADALALDQQVSAEITRSLTGWTPRRPLPSLQTQAVA